MKNKSCVKREVECLVPIKTDFELRIAANPLHNTEDMEADIVYSECGEGSVERSYKRFACYAEKLIKMK